MGSRRRRRAPGEGRRGEEEPPAPPRCRHPEPEVPPEPPSLDSGWHQRLLQEWEDECGEPQCYQEDFDVPEPEPYDAWADRIAEEHHRKRSRWGGLSASRGPLKSARGPSPWHHEAESQLYWQRQHEKEEQVQQARAQRAGRGPKTSASAREPLNNQEPSEAGTLLRYDDIPWPCTGGGPEAMAAAALAAVPAPPAGAPGPYRRLLRQQRARWHPDRFAQHWGSRLHPRDRQRVLATVTALSQALNRRADAAK
ncbi:NF-kappa-B inhibitor-like protein 1 [Rhea pennata]|uniref:NF-kappa-B inhibitor-like protein 1 n=1 Tax=Rhea pennata TaxID=8795 RepID=UPI002E26FCCB